MKNQKKEKNLFSLPLSLESSPSLVAALVQHHAVKLLLEPLHRVLLREPVLDADAGLALAALGDAVTRAVEHDVEVHPCFFFEFVEFRIRYSRFRGERRGRERGRRGASDVDKDVAGPKRFRFPPKTLKAMEGEAKKATEKGLGQRFCSRARLIHSPRFETR